MKTICLYRKGKVRWISPSDLIIDKSTPRGEPADLYERKPYNGKRLLSDGEYLGKIVDGLFEIESCNMTEERAKVIRELDVEVNENHLFHNGHVYTTWEYCFKTLKESL